MIHEVRKLVNEEGMVLLWYVPFGFVKQVDGEPVVGSRFVGVVHMTSPAGLIPIEFDFPGEVKSPQEAFAVFRETAQAYVKQLEEDAPRVLTPDQWGL